MSRSARTALASAVVVLAAAGCGSSDSADTTTRATTRTAAAAPPGAVLRAVAVPTRSGAVEAATPGPGAGGATALVRVVAGQGRFDLAVAPVSRSGGLGRLQRAGRASVADAPRVAAGPDGSIAVVAQTSVDGQFVATTREADGRFGAARRITRSAGKNRVTSVATGGGRLLVGAEAEDGSGPVVLRRRPDGSAAAPLELDGGVDGGTSDVQVAVDGRGRGLVLWLATAGSGRVVAQAATVTADGGLGRPVTLPGSATQGPADEVRFQDASSAQGLNVALDADGAGTVSWQDGPVTRVARASSTTGVDVRSAAAVRLTGRTRVAADGSAVVVGERGPVGDRVGIATRRAGSPFGAVAERRLPGGALAHLELSGDTWSAATGYTFSDDDERSETDAIAGTLGGVPSRVVRIRLGRPSEVDVVSTIVDGVPVVWSRVVRDNAAGTRSVGGTVARRLVP